MQNLYCHITSLLTILLIVLIFKFLPWCINYSAIMTSSFLSCANLNILFSLNLPGSFLGWTTPDFYILFYVAINYIICDVEHVLRFFFFPFSFLFVFFMSMCSNFQKREVNPPPRGTIFFVVVVHICLLWSICIL